MRDLLSLTINENSFSYNILTKACEDGDLNHRLRKLEITSQSLSEKEQLDFLSLISVVTTKCVYLNTLLLAVHLNYSFNSEM